MPLIQGGLHQLVTQRLRAELRRVLDDTREEGDEDMAGLRYNGPMTIGVDTASEPPETTAYQYHRVTMNHPVTGKLCHGTVLGESIHNDNRCYDIELDGVMSDYFTDQPLEDPQMRVMASIPISEVRLSGERRPKDTLWYSNYTQSRLKMIDDERDDAKKLAMDDRDPFRVLAANGDYEGMLNDLKQRVLGNDYKAIKEKFTRDPIFNPADQYGVFDLAQPYGGVLSASPDFVYSPHTWGHARIHAPYAPIAHGDRIGAVISGHLPEFELAEIAAQYHVIYRINMVGNTIEIQGRESDVREAGEIIMRRMQSIARDEPQITARRRFPGTLMNY